MGLLRAVAQPQMTTDLSSRHAKTDRFLRLIIPGLLLVLAAAGTIPFWMTDLDLRAAAVFFDAGNEDQPWPIADLWFWRLFYKAAPALTALLAITGLLMIVAGAIVPEEWSHFRLYGLFILLVVVLGPGLFVNAIFKDHWGRPRPREVQTFDGKHEYLPPLLKGPSGRGKSFPCGHCSVAYALSALWLVLRRRHPRLGWGLLALSLVLGGYLGYARMAAGAHFLSDVIWSAVMAWGVAWLLYFYILKIPQREVALENPESRVTRRNRPITQTIVYSILGGGTLVGILFATPVHEDFAYGRQTTSSAPDYIRIEVSHGDVYLDIHDRAEPVVEIGGQARGFGFPNAKVRTKGSFEKISDERGEVLYRVERTGFFTDYGARLNVRLAAEKLAEVTVNLGEGELRIEREDGTAEDIPVILNGKKVERRQSEEERPAN